MNTATSAPAIVTCAANCGASFFLVPARGERANYCLDCANQIVGLVRGDIGGVEVENS